MKKGRLLLLSLVLITVMTGCGKKELSCVMTQVEEGVETKNNINVTLKNDKIDSMKVTGDITILEEYNEQKEELINTLRGTYNSLGYEVNDTDNGLKVSMDADIDYLRSLVLFDLGEKVSYDEVKEALESIGYICE